MNKIESKANNKQNKEIKINSESDVNLLIDKKIMFFQEVIQKTILFVQQNSPNHPCPNMLYIFVEM